MIKHKTLNLPQQDSAEYFPLAWQMLTSRPPLKATVTVVVLEAPEAEVAGEGEMEMEEMEVVEEGEEGMEMEVDETEEMEAMEVEEAGDVKDPLEELVVLEALEALDPQVRMGTVRGMGRTVAVTIREREGTGWEEITERQSQERQQSRRKIENPNKESLVMGCGQLNNGSNMDKNTRQD